MLGFKETTDQLAWQTVCVYVMLLLARHINRQDEVLRGFGRRCQCGRLRRAVEKVVGVVRRMTTVVAMVARCRVNSVHILNCDRCAGVPVWFLSSLDVSI